MKGRVTERPKERVSVRDGGKSGGRGWHLYWQRKRKGDGERET